MRYKKKSVQGEILREYYSSSLQNMYLQGCEHHLNRYRDISRERERLGSSWVRRVSREGREEEILSRSWRFISDDYSLIERDREGVFEKIERKKSASLPLGWISCKNRWYRDIFCKCNHSEEIKCVSPRYDFWRDRECASERAWNVRFEEDEEYVALSNRVGNNYWKSSHSSDISAPTSLHREFMSSFSEYDLWNWDVSGGLIPFLYSEYSSNYLSSAELKLSINRKLFEVFNGCLKTLSEQPFPIFPLSGAGVMYSILSELHEIEYELKKYKLSREQSKRVSIKDVYQIWAKGGVYRPIFRGFEVILSPRNILYLNRDYGEKFIEFASSMENVEGIFSLPIYSDRIFLGKEMYMSQYLNKIRETMWLWWVRLREFSRSWYLIESSYWREEGTLKLFEKRELSENVTSDCKIPALFNSTGYSSIYSSNISSGIR